MIDDASTDPHPEPPDVFTDDPVFDELLVECRRVLGLKGRDYTIGSVDRLANFRVAAEAFGIRPEIVLGIYFYKHVAAVFSYIKTGGQSESEPIRGRIVDVINYMLLLYRMIREKSGGQP